MQLGVIERRPVHQVLIKEILFLTERLVSHAKNGFWGENTNHSIGRQTEADFKNVLWIIDRSNFSRHDSKMIRSVLKESGDAISGVLNHDKFFVTKINHSIDSLWSHSERLRKERKEREENLNLRILFAPDHPNPLLELDDDPYYNTRGGGC